MMPKKGDRVGAILGQDAEGLKVLGFGVYLGDLVPKNAVGPIGDSIAMAEQANPCIELDDSKGRVWGYECWWGPEDNIRAEIANAEKRGIIVTYVDIEEERHKAYGEQ